jgi:hypothetical protein
MSEPKIFDYKDKMCGMIPEMEELLRTTDEDVVEFIVLEHKLPQIINALATSDMWEVKVTRELNTARIRFTRENHEPGSKLELIY